MRRRILPLYPQSAHPLMFKRFLKFFRGDENTPAEPFEGSYLDHLLTRLKPHISEQLEDCPEHDPLLLVVAGILRFTMMNAWSPQLRTPLVDSQSPGRPAKSSASQSPAPDSASTSEFAARTDEDEEPEEEIGTDTIDESMSLAGLQDESEDESEDEGEDEDEDEDEGEGEGEDEDEDEGDNEDDAIELDDDAIEETRIPEPPPMPPMPRSTRKTEEIDVEEVRQASLQASLTETMEMDRVEPELHDPTIEIEQDTLFGAQSSADGRPRVDGEEVLQAGRVFLGLLIENDRLPIELQLSVAETTLARDLLLGFFVGNDDFEEKARKLLTLVEQKFGEGLFSQARILLQLFHTDEQTRINNDRNLFYEDMILRLGIRRRHRMSAEELSRFDTLLSDARTPAGALAVSKWLSEVCLIHLHSFNRDPAQVAEWSAVLDDTSRVGARENFLRYLPARRWRAIGSFEEYDILEQMRRHVTLETAREFVIAQVKTCYFVLRAVGDTGLEAYLDTFFDWSSETFGVNGTRLMPELYKRSMMDPEPMATILDEIYEKHYAEATLELIEEITDEQIDAAVYDALQAMGKCDLGEVAPGYYDLGSFVFDQLFGVEYSTCEFPFKIHRLT